MESYTRQAATIDGVFCGPDDHGFVTMWLYLKWPGGGQGFGGVHLGDTTEGLDCQSYLADVLRTFGVQHFSDLKGLKCFALRCFDEWGAMIEGVESADTGRRFTITDWCKRHVDPNAKDPLAREIESLESSIASHERRVREQKERLRSIRDRYVAWEASS